MGSDLWDGGRVLPTGVCGAGQGAQLRELKGS